MADVKQLHTRFLFPFFFDRGRWGEMEVALGSDWKRQEPPRLYREELLQHAKSFLFEDIAYFRFSDPDRLFPKSLTAALANSVIVPVKIPRGGGVELFLTQQGVGILAIMLSPGDVPTAVALDFNYRLARKSSAPPAKLSVSDAADEAFTLGDVADRLLESLMAFGVRHLQSQFSVYTVASFDDKVVLDDAACVAWAGPFLSGLAQIEEATHAGARAGAVDVPNRLMNRCHWAAVGVLGAAHVIADQPPPSWADFLPFNNERIYRVRDKYFVPYVLALVQRLVLIRIAEQATELMRSGDGRGLRELRMDLLKFGVGGRFSQVSSRQALHRYYRLVQEGLDVRDAWTDVRNALADLDALNLASNIANNLGVITRVQHAAHALEYVIISVYCAHLWHMFAAENKGLHEIVLQALAPVLPEGRTLPHDWFVAWGVLFFAGLGWASAYLYNHRRARQE